MRLLLALPLLLLACDKPMPGEACEVTGDGFTRKDPCAYHCVEWEVECADGSRVVPDMCSGVVCRADSECSPGFTCAPTHSDAGACLPTSVCSGGFAAGRWESGPE